MDDQPISDTELSIAARSRVFVLLDGTFVVRWQENRIQELHTGQYRLYEKRNFGAPITDYELKQLQTIGIVEAYDNERVWLCPLPEHYEIQYMTLWEQQRARSYYLNTTLAGDRLDDVVAELLALGLQDEFLPRVRDGFVVLWGHNGLSFHRIDDAEKARNRLGQTGSSLFADAVVAFVETTMR